MAITTQNGLIAAMPGQHRHIYKASQTSEGAGLWHSLWLATGQPGAGAAPGSTNGVIPTSATAGAIPFVDPGGGNTGYLGRIGMLGTTVGTLILYDRLWANSGLVGNVTTAQTFTQPALTRPDALGGDVELWGEVYTAMGATGSVFTATYTDQDGNTGNSASYTMPANALAVGQMFPFTLAAGDSGVRLVTQVQLSISTGTAGNFGLTLLRRIAEVPMYPLSVQNVQDFFATGGPEIYPGACLAMMVQCSATTTGGVQGSLNIIEG